MVVRIAEANTAGSIVFACTRRRAPVCKSLSLSAALNLIVFRDCTLTKVMVDYSSLYPRGVRAHPHYSGQAEDMSNLPFPRRRCRANPQARYYFIDFGISTRFPATAVGPRVITGGHGRDRAPPELSNTIPYDPFKLDVFILGNYFRTSYILVRIPKSGVS